MGTGWGGFDNYPYTYCHASLYQETHDIELVGIVDPDPSRLIWGTTRWETRGYDSLEAGLESKPDFVSICTPADVREEIFRVLPPSVRGVLCEKPYGLPHLEAAWQFPVQVHYPRRFCPFHRAVKDGLYYMMVEPVSVYVWGRRDMTTLVHFTNLAQWLGAHHLVYSDNTGEIPGTNSYRIEAGKWAVDFRNGGVAGGFMELALRNLRDYIDGYDQLDSPITDAVASERWATEIMAGR